MINKENDFIEKFYRLRDYSDKICQASDVLGVEFFESWIGNLYDEYYSVVFDMLGYKDWEPEIDSIMEEFGELLYGQEKPTRNEVKLFWQHYSK